jgi:hypothetical protein
LNESNDGDSSSRRLSPFALTETENSPKILQPQTISSKNTVSIVINSPSKISKANDNSNLREI